MGWGWMSTELHFQQVAGFRALDGHRAGERVNHAGVHAREIGLGYSRTHLAVEGVAGFQRNLLALVNLDHGRDVGMPAVMACVRLLAKALAAVDGNALHQVIPPRPRCTRGRFAGCYRRPPTVSTTATIERSRRHVLRNSEP